MKIGGGIWDFGRENLGISVGAAAAARETRGQKRRVARGETANSAGWRAEEIGGVFGKFFGGISSCGAGRVAGAGRGRGFSGFDEGFPGFGAAAWLGRKS